MEFKLDYLMLEEFFLEGFRKRNHGKLKVNNYA